MVLALSVGLGILVVSLLLFAMTTALIVHLVVWFIRSGYTALGFWKNVAVMMVVFLLTAIAHLIQISLWALVILMLGEVSTFERACYYSGQSYTSLGYGDIILSE
jgi:Ion channel